MKNLFSLFILLFVSTFIYGQDGPTNGDKREILGYFDSAELNTDDNSGPCGTSGWVSDRPSCAFGNKEDDYYVKLTVDGSNYYNQYFLGNAPGEVSLPTLGGIDDNNSSLTNFVARIDIWEEDNGNGVYDGGIDDNSCGNSATTINLLTKEPGLLYTQTINCPSSTNSGNFNYAYSYTNGNNLADALTFGQINANDSKSHENRILLSGSLPSFDARLSYTNEISSSISGFNNSPEIIYKFEIPTCVKVKIKTVSSASNQPQIKLAKLSGSQGTTITHEQTINGNSQFFDFLESGEYIAVVEGNSNVVFEILIEASTNPIVPGSISYNGQTTAPLSYNPSTISNSTSASGGYQSYQWKKKVGSTGPEQIIGGATSASYNPPSLTEAGDHIFWREAVNTTCETSEATNEIKISILNNNGVVSGQITSPPTGDGGSPVSGVTVTLTNLEQIEGGIDIGDITLTRTTDSQGEYTFSNFYVGPDPTDWKVTPNFSDHTFSPVNQTFELSPTVPVKNNRDFDDVSTFSFSGKVFQDYDGTECGIAGVEITRDGNPLPIATTDVNGFYTFSIPSIGRYTITAGLLDHTFVQLADSIFIDEDKMNMDIENTTTRVLNIDFKGGCNAAIGQLELNIEDDNNCVSTVITTAVNGLYNLTLPAKDYTIAVTTYIPVEGASQDFTNLFNAATIEAYFNNLNLNADLTVMDTTMTLVYQPDPTLIVEGWPELPVECEGVVNSSIEYPYLQSLETAIIAISSFDFPPIVNPNYPQGCKLDTSTLLVTDNIRSFINDPYLDTIPMSQNTLFYSLMGGIPNLGAPYNKVFELALLNETGNVATYTNSMIVEGSRARSSTFTTVSPELPLYIIRDPPGDNSFAELTVGNSRTFRTSSSAGKSGGAEVYAKALLDIEDPTGLNGAWGEVGGKIGYTEEHINITESEITSIEETNFSTANTDSPVNIGESADVFFGAAFNLKYSLSDFLSVNLGRCEVDLDVKLIIDPDTFATNYFYTKHFIEVNILPNLEELVGLVPPDSVAFYEDQITIWENLLLRNSNLKKDAEYLDNYSYSAGGTLNPVHTIETTESVTNEWTQTLDVGVFANFGGKLYGIGAEVGGSLDFQWTTFNDTTNSTTQTNTSSYTLNDDDSDIQGSDGFSVTVLKDKVYGTPVFNVSAAETSCPYEKAHYPDMMQVLLHFQVLSMTYQLMM